MSNWNRKDASTTDGLGLVRDQDYEYTGKLVRKVYDPFRGSSREYVWTDDAYCVGSDPELFQLNRLGDPEVDHISELRTDLLAQHNRAKVERAKLVCEGCPVRATCLATASTSDLHWSVRGGQTPKRLAGQKAIPAFPIQDYIPWQCKHCGGEEFTWYQNRGVKRRRCAVCAND